MLRHVLVTERDNNTGLPVAKRVKRCHDKSAFGGHDLPNEILLLILDILPFEDRANLAAVNSQFRMLALPTIDKLKLMRDIPDCAPVPASPRSWLQQRTASPSRNMHKLQVVIARSSSVLTYLNLLGSNILNQDLMAWIYQIDLPKLENFKFPNGTDLYIFMLRDLARNNTAKWPHLNQISIGFGSKLEVPEECLDLVRLMRHTRPGLKSNIARCHECQRLYFTDSRVKCEVCGNSICSQHFTRISGNHCPLSMRFKCPFSMLKYHTRCASDHDRWGCASLNKEGKRFACYKVLAYDPDSSAVEDPDELASPQAANLVRRDAPIDQSLP